MGVYQKNGNWFIDYSVNGKRHRKRIGPDKKLAETVLKKIRVEIAENKYLDVKKEQKVRFEDFADEYLNCHSKVNNRSWKNAELSNINRLKLLFTGKYLHEITPQMVEQMKARVVQEVSPATTNRVLTQLKSIFNKAILWDKFDGKNPVKTIKFYKEQPRLRFLEKEEIAKLLSNCDKKFKPFVTIALHTGMRKGEIGNLKWHDIDFQRNIIYLYLTKNGEKREVPMNEQVRNALISVKKCPDTPYVFHRRENKPYYNLRKSFFTACQKSGITNFRFHDIRHTFASQLVMNGIDLNTVRELLGHKSLEMTLRYSHLSQDHKKRAVDILASKIGSFLPLGKTDGQEPLTTSDRTQTNINAYEINCPVV